MGLYGSNPVAASRIDGFLDATLVFAREAQVYLLAANKMEADIRERMAGAYEFYLNGIEQALSATPYIAGEELTIADIGFACDLAQFLRERVMVERLKDQGFAPVSGGLERDYPRCHTHLTRLVAPPAICGVPGRLCQPVGRERRGLCPASMNMVNSYPDEYR